MPSLRQDIEEFMGLPYEEVVKPAEKHNGDMPEIMFPFGITKENLFNYYKSDYYSSTLFLRASQSQDKNEPSMPQILANIVDRYCNQDVRILYYRCGYGMAAIGLNSMGFKNITLADIPNRYFDFLKSISNKYGLDFKFIDIDHPDEDHIKRKYDIIILNDHFDIFHQLHKDNNINSLIDHLEDNGYLYVSQKIIEKDILRLDSDFIKKVSTDDSGGVIYQKIYSPVIIVPAKYKDKRIFPQSISLLSTLPGTACGIATYTKWLSDALSAHYHTEIFRDINSGVPKSSLILASIEFGIFPEVEMLVNEQYNNNWKFAIWHTVFDRPDKEHLDFITKLDDEYDGHIVHTVLQKAFLSKYVTKPVNLIQHGSLLWTPIPKDEAKEKMWLSKDDKIAFAFGFAQNSKGFYELIDAYNKIDIQGFKLIISAGIHGEDVEYCTSIKDDLQKHAKETNDDIIVLGKYLSEDEINIYASAADVLIFNYKTPKNVASTSGAMNRVLAAGKPIICPDDNRLENLVNGQNCIKFSSGDIDYLAVCIKMILSDTIIADKLGKNNILLAEQTSWDNIAKQYMSMFGREIKYSQDYYDEEYFVGSDGGKNYLTPSGEIQKWSYYNPDGEWLGAKYIMEAIKSILNPSNMLSVGEGRGTFCAYAKDAGISAKGIDFSEWAIEHPYDRANGLIELGDVRDLNFFDSSYGLVFCSDIMEHIYIDDLSKAISEIQRVAKKWIFFNIGASNMEDDKGDLVVQSDSLPPKDRLVTTVSGHVTVKSEKWWRDKLSNDKWKLRDDLVEQFRKIVPEAVITNWKCILILEKVG